MNLRPSGRFLAAIGSSLCLVELLSILSFSGWGQEAAPAAGPATTDLLRSPPFDRITLIDGTVLIVDPVSPRPLPALDPAKTRKQEKARPKGSKVEIPLEGNIGLPGEPSKFRTPQQEKAEEEQEEESVRTVKIHLLQEAEVRDFTVKRSSIKTIEYFEDLLLAEGDRLTLARDFARAFECFLRVKTRNPDWPRLDDHVNRLLFAEGSAAMLEGDHERGLRLLRELLGRKRDLPGAAGSACLGLPGLDLPGPGPGPVRQGAALPSRAGGDGSRAPGRSRHARPVRRPRHQARSRNPSPPAILSASTP